jgi:hypothetical protein
MRPRLRQLVNRRMLRRLSNIILSEEHVYRAIEQPNSPAPEAQKATRVAQRKALGKK